MQGFQWTPSVLHCSMNFLEKGDYVVLHFTLPIAFVPELHESFVNLDRIASFTSFLQTIIIIIDI